MSSFSPPAASCGGSLIGSRESKKRRRRDEAKKLLARSIDPSVQRKADKHAGKDSSFRAVAKEVIIRRLATAL